VLVREIHGWLRPEREPAYNTVLTVVEILYRKGWLAREKGRPRLPLPCDGEPGRLHRP
jgi:predicted transcriptional regulator